MCLKNTSGTSFLLERYLDCGIDIQQQIYNVEVFESCSSTNTLLKDRLRAEFCLLDDEDKRNPINPFWLYCTESQTAGRGRLGRSFFSPKKTGLYFSFSFPLYAKSKTFELITPLLGLLMAESIETVFQLAFERSGNTSKTQSHFISLKWINDLYLENLKLGGILTESLILDKENLDSSGVVFENLFSSNLASKYENKNLRLLICGLGLNFLEPKESFGQELSKIATSLEAFFEKQANQEYSLVTEEAKIFYGFCLDYLKNNFVTLRHDVLMCFLNRFEKSRVFLEDDKFILSIKNRYETRLSSFATACYLEGKPQKIYRVQGLTDDFALILKSNTGECFEHREGLLIWC